MLVPPIHIVRIESPGAQGKPEELSQQAARVGDSRLRSSSQETPSPHVLFRPEEIHLVSNQGQLASPL